MNAFSLRRGPYRAALGRRLIPVIAAKNVAEAQFRSIGGNLLERGKLATGSQGGTEQRRSLSEALNDTIERWRILCFQLMRTTLISQGNVLHWLPS